MGELSASQVFDELQRLADELEDLDKSGRVSMDKDRFNRDWNDLDHAMKTARDALALAIDATRWMKTRMDE